MPVRNWVWKGYRYNEVYQNATKPKLITSIKCHTTKYHLKIIQNLDVWGKCN
jgi:hypothetical protein